MKSVVVATWQAIVGDNGTSSPLGFIHLNRASSSNTLRHEYWDGASNRNADFSNFFQNLDNQWIHIVIVCDYYNKTIKAYRNGVQFGATQNLVGIPVFPSPNRLKYVGANSSGAYRIADGSLDEVRIYNRGLSAEEVSSIYNATKSKYGF